MKVINLKEVFEKCPDCLSSRTAFRSVLMDLYPSEKRLVNVLTLMVECGAAQKIKNKPELSETDIQALILQMENEYGIAPEHSLEGIKIWIAAYGKTVLNSIHHAPERHPDTETHYMPLAEIISVPGETADYETEILDDGSLRIKKFIGLERDTVVVPNQIDGMPVRVIGEETFAGCSGIQKVVISEGITDINDDAFAGCTSLSHVELPQSLINLGSLSDSFLDDICPNGVFYECALTKITLPTGLSYIGKSVFHECEQLAAVTIPDHINTVESCCFWGCTSLTSIVLPHSLTVIKSGAFAFTSLKAVEIPESVIEIQDSAFYYCDHLSEIILHEGILKIGKEGFADCPALHTITLPHSLQEIGDNAFISKVICLSPDKKRLEISKPEDLTMFCYKGSYALQYARENGFNIRIAAE